MSFASLAKEIEAKRALVKSLKGNGGKTYMTRAEITAKGGEDHEAIVVPKRKRDDDEDSKSTNVEENEEDIKRQRILQDLNEYKKKLKAEEIEEEASKVSKEDQKLLDSISDEELKDKLKSLNEPVVIFGESRLEKIKRLNAKTLEQEAEKRKLEQVRYEKELDFHIIAEDIRDDTDKVYIQLRSYIKFLLAEWEKSVKVDDEVQQKLLMETKKNLVPLLVKLRQKTLAKDVFTSLSTTLKYLQDQNYLMSNDSYLNLSIGNACWPIGVLNIGIHARSSHTRLTGAEEKSNIMTDEKTRGWLMGVKRLITFAEKKWPN